MPALGTTAKTACAGNDSRLSDARPASDVSSWAKASTKPTYSWSEITSKPSTFTPASHTHTTSWSNATPGFGGSTTLTAGDTTAAITMPSTHASSSNYGLVKVWSDGTTLYIYN